MVINYYKFSTKDILIYYKIYNTKYDAVDCTNKEIYSNRKCKFFDEWLDNTIHDKLKKVSKQKFDKIYEECSLKWL